MAQPGGSLGNLCLGGVIGRFSRAGEIGAASSYGQRELTVPLTDMPQLGTPTMATAGQIWRFHALYRDSNGGTAGSNFTDASAVLLR
ncbi:MAG: hypothetical protein ACJA2W_003575 [Planctomycetota bacterium]